ncbi:MAG TPA: MarR family transcriptional regulator [Nocardioidaceae bacterium]|nr:MarR family transcriptional regulator [Nocardioidaceae bacterium]
MTDTVQRIVDAWRRERPDLDPSPLLVLGRVNRLAALVDGFLRPPFAEAGLSNGDFDLLAALRRAGEPFVLTPSRLAEEMLVTNGAATKRIDRLERQRLVSRAPSGHDARSREVALTEDGLRVVDDLIARHLANEARLLEALTAEQRDQLGSLLGLLASALEDRRP